MKIKLKKDLHAANGAMQLNIDLDIPDGSFITIYGPSGAGKTSILRMIAGLMNPDEGIIEIDNNIWYHSNSNTCLKPQHRSAGLVFQDYALFPNMTVLENIQYALKNNTPPDSLQELLSTFDLIELQDRKSTTLSGGQQQRVALARAIANKPKVLLLDEPLSALDYAMRLNLQEYLQHVHATYDITIILVSHDIAEIIRMSDEVYVLNHGRIDKSGKPSEVFSGSTLSGKFQVTGEILEITKEDVIYVVSVLCGTEVVKAVITDPASQNLNPGDRVMVVSKSFNPMILKIMD